MVFLPHPARFCDFVRFADFCVAQLFSGKFSSVRILFLQILTTHCLVWWVPLRVREDACIWMDLHVEASISELM